MNPENDKKNTLIADSTLKDLNDAGVEISARISEENEFSNTPGVQSEAVLVPPVPETPTIADMVKPKETPASIPSAIPVAKPSAIQNEINAALGVYPSKSEIKKETVYQNDPSIKQLRTFKTDAEEAVRYQNVSKVNIAVAEHKKKEEASLIQYESETKRSPMFLILGIMIVLVLVGIGGGVYYWLYIRTYTPINNVTKTFSAKTLIPYDKIGTVTLAGTGSNSTLSEISQNLSQTDTQIGQIYALIPLPVGTTTVSAPVSDIFAGTQMPDRLSRSLGTDYMIGTYIYNQNSPFVILKNTFFQNAFAGMLEWEKNMRNDLISIIRVSNPSEQPIIANSDIFNDVVVSNVDSRVLHNAAGDVILAYAFADKDTIVIATNTDSLKYVLGRLLSVRVVQ